MGLFEGWGDAISGAFSSIGGWDTVSKVASTAGAAYDIYSGFKSQNLADQYANLAFASAEKQDEFAEAMWDRYKEKYWPLEDLQIDYTMADTQTLRPAYEKQVAYQAQRLNEQLAQAKTINPILDSTEKSLIRKLVEGEDVLADRLRSQATADVGASYASQREQDIRSMGLAGINPNSGQMQNYLNRMGQSQALAEATARTQASRQAEDIAISRQSQALNYAKGATLPTYQVTPSVSTSSLASGLAGITSGFTGLAETADKNAQASWNGANTLLNALSGGKYGRI